MLSQGCSSDLGFWTSPAGQRWGGGAESGRELCPKLSARVPGARPRAKGRGPTLELKGPGKGCQSRVPGQCLPPHTHKFPAPGWAGCGGSCWRVGRMWGWGQLKRSLTVVSPAPPSFPLPPHPPLQITCFQPGHRRTISPFPRKDMIDMANLSHQRLQLYHAFLLFAS